MIPSADVLLNTDFTGTVANFKRNSMFNDPKEKAIKNYEK